MLGVDEVILHPLCNSLTPNIQHPTPNIQRLSLNKERMKKNQIDIVTMGCSKNLVDSELIMKQFEENGFHCTHDSKRPQGEIAVINTCGFIEAAKEESINTILEFINRKKNGQLNKLYVMGCLSQRYKDELEAELPEVDKFYGKFNYKQLLTDLGRADVPACNGVRHLTTPRHYAYVKIAEVVIVIVLIVPFH